MVVGRLLSYWEGNFSGAMLNFGWVNKKKTNKSWATFKTLTWHEPLNPDWFGFQDPYSGLWNNPYIAGDCIPSPTYTAQLVMPALLNFLHRANHAHGCSCPHQCFSNSAWVKNRQKTCAFSCFSSVAANPAQKKLSNPELASFLWNTI